MWRDGDVLTAGSEPRPNICRVNRINPISLLTLNQRRCILRAAFSQNRRSPQMRFQLFVMRRVVWVLAFCILASSLSLPALGQAVNAEITGLVTDPTGAVISDA